MRLPHVGLIVCALTLVLAGSAGAIDIAFDYRYDGGFFTGNPQAVAAMEAAAAGFEGFEDSLLSIQPFGSNTWTQDFRRPDTNADVSLSNPGVSADTLVVYVGGRNLGSTTLGLGGPGGWGASGSTSWLARVARRGQSGAEGADPTDFGPWGGTVTFNTTKPWHYDHTTPPVSGKNDLFSVATHELAHLFGFGLTGSWHTYVSGSSFTGPRSTSVHGGGVPLSDSRSHWDFGTFSTVDGAAQEAAMDPNVTVGTRKAFTVLDYASLDDIGWDVPSPVVGDFSGDWALGAADIDALQANLGDPAYDLTGDNLADGADVDHVVRELLGAEYGDITLNGAVDGADLSLMAANWLTPAGAGWATGDLTGDGSVDGADLSLMAANWLYGAGASVPEPASGALLLCGLAAIVRRRAKRA